MTHADPKPPTEKAQADRAFERKIRRTRWFLFLEQVWLRAWLAFAIIGAFVLVSLLELWSGLGDTAHLGLLGVFGVALTLALGYAVRTAWPTREDAIRRIESVSGVPHRPASSYEDTLTASAEDPATRAIWRAHRARMAAMLERLKTGTPSPRTDRLDPLALRALGVLGLALLASLAGTTLPEKLKGAFHLASSDRLSEARLDAWVTPPAYTGRPPLMLADGANPIGRAALDTAGKADAEGKPQDVPDRSVLVVRASGLGSASLRLEVPGPDPEKPQLIEAEVKSGGQDVQEARFDVRKAATVRVFAGSTPIASWRLGVIPDQPPAIAYSKKLEQTPRGSMKISYKAADDYGVASAEVKLERAKPKPSDPNRAWAEAKPLSGPRPPLQRPPVLPLRLPDSAAKDGEASTYLEFASHPWAGLRVKMTLVAKDQAGQTGRSDDIELVLPERKFRKPLARAVIEQRRKLIDDPRYRPQVTTALGALTLAPEDFIEDTHVYLGLRTAYHRLGGGQSREIIKSVIDQLWHVALRIEDGNLSDAERRLREAKDRLAKAIEEGAPEEEIAQLMKELKEAFREFAQEMSKQRNEETGQENGQDPNNQELSQKELDEMLNELEEMAKSGSREEAMQMLSEMEDLMERMQAGQSNEQQAKENKALMKMMEELSSMLGEQQQLMDDTFGEQRKQASGEDGEQQQGEKGQKGQRQGAGQGQKGQKGQRAQGQNGQNGQDGAEGEDGGELGQGDEKGQQGRGRGQLGERQRELKERLARLQEEMRSKRAGDQKKLGDAKDAMEGAEDALGQGDLETATEEQGRALDKMRQSAQSMAEQLLANTPQRNGQQGNSRDPLGRPQKTQGPDLGTSVKVPGAIDKQRAREILEELRRRLGEATRPAGELDYLERLEKRF